MFKSRSNYVKKPKWDTASKIESRLYGVVNPYREITGRSSLPAGKQYWTMCGAHYEATDDGIQAASGEMGQIVDSGLITLNQWRGIDRELVVIENNRKLYPEARWLCGDFKEQLAQACIRGEFNPGIINYDGVMGPKFGLAYLRSIMLLLDANVTGELFLSANFVLRSPYRKDLSFDPMKVVSTFVDKHYMVPDHWTIVPKFWHYRGGASKGSPTRMGTFIFLKKPHSGMSRFTPGRNVLDDKMPDNVQKTVVQGV